MDREIIDGMWKDENENAYRRFKERMGEGDYREAYGIFNSNPEIMGDMSLSEIDTAYNKFRGHVGTREAIGFASEAVSGMAQLLDHLATSEGMNSLREEVEMMEAGKWLEKQFSDQNQDQD